MFGHRVKEIVKKRIIGNRYAEKLERNFLAALLMFFVFFGALFFVFIIPKINPGFFILNGGGKNIPVARQEPDPAENFSMGVKLSSNKEYSQALEYFQKAVEKDPENVNYLNELAVTYYGTKNYNEALKVYDKLIRIDEGNRSVYDNRVANIYWIRKEYNLAETYFREAIASDPKSAISYNNLALMLDEENRKEDAVKVLEDGIRDSGGKELQTTLSIVFKNN